MHFKYCVWILQYKITTRIYIKKNKYLIMYWLLAAGFQSTPSTKSTHFFPFLKKKLKTNIFLSKKKHYTTSSIKTLCKDLTSIIIRSICSVYISFLFRFHFNSVTLKKKNRHASVQCVVAATGGGGDEEREGIVCWCCKVC